METITKNIFQTISDFNNIKDAIISKDVIVPNGTPTSLYGELIDSIGNSTIEDSVIDNIIGDMKVDIAEEAISKGTYVSLEYPERYNSVLSIYNGSYINAIMLTDKRIFLTTLYSAFTAFVYEYDNGVFTRLGYHAFTTTVSRLHSITKLSESSVVVSYTNSSIDAVRFMAYTINEAGGITAGAEFSPTTTNYAYAGTDGTAIIPTSETSAIALYRGTNTATTRNLLGLLLNINGTTITQIGARTISAIADSGRYKNGVALDNGRILIASTNYTTKTNPLTFKVITVSGSSLTINSDTIVDSPIAGDPAPTQIMNEYYGISKRFNLVKLTPSKVILFCPFGYRTRIYAACVNISEENVIDVKYIPIFKYGIYLRTGCISGVRIDDNRAFVAYHGIDSDIQYAYISMDDAGNSILEDRGLLNLDKTFYTKNLPSIDVVKSEDDIIIFYPTLSTQQVAVLTKDVNKKFTKFSGKIAGVAKESANAGETIQVIVPNN